MADLEEEKEVIMSGRRGKAGGTGRSKKTGDTLKIIDMDGTYDVNEVYGIDVADEPDEIYGIDVADEPDEIYGIDTADEPDETCGIDAVDRIDETYGADGIDERYGIDEAYGADNLDEIYGIEGTGKVNDIDGANGISVMYEVKEAYGIIESKVSVKRHGKKHRPGIFRVARRAFLVLATFVVVTFVGAYSTLWVICNGTSKAAKNLFVSTILETGALKFLATWYFTDEEILAITNENSMAQIFEDVNTGMISVPSQGASGNGAGSGITGGAADPENPEKTDSEGPGAGAEGNDGYRNPDGTYHEGPGGASDEDGFRIVEIAGRSFMAKMMIVRDPSRVKLATIYPWSDDDHSKDGKTLGELVTQGNHLAGINGGEYYSSGNWGGKPKGLVVCEGQIQYNVPQRGDVMIGFNRDNILVIKDIGNMTAEQVKTMVEEDQIRDAVSFKDEKGSSNHFAKLLINGKAREISGTGSGANPRTAIGQKEDGTVLMLVTDGRGSSGHLGATAADLIAIMQEYGAVNAANLDGGSSSAMYCDGVYEMTSVTLYYSTSSWKLPTAYVVENREG